MNNFKRLSAIILAFCTAATVLSSCGNHNETTDITKTAPVTAQSEIKDNVSQEYITALITDVEGKTVIQTIAQTIAETVKSNTTVANGEEVVTEKQTVKINVTDKNGNTSVSFSEKIVTVPAKTTKSPAATTVKHNTTIKATVPATKKTVINDTVNEKSVGISMLSKSDPVQIGNHASIIIKGTPGKIYSINFYESPEMPANYSALEDKKADANGFVSWSFEIRNSCDLGKRKVIIKESNSDNYIETSITVK